jgi:hypothetical protein
MNDRAYIYYVSTPKHLYELGNYQYCSEKGKHYNLKYALFALQVIDTSDNDRFIFGGSCVPIKCSNEEIREGFEQQMENIYSDTYHKSHGLTVTVPDEQEPKASVGTVLTIIVYSAIVLLVIIGTFVDRTSIFDKTTPSPVDSIREGSLDHIVQDTPFKDNNKNKIGSFFASFSVPQNFKRIFLDKFSINSELKVFNGIFVTSLIFVILQNVYFVSGMYGIVDSSTISNYETQFPQFILLRLHLIYEIFFFSIGFITTAKIWTNFYFYNHCKASPVFEILRYMYRRFFPMVFLILGTVFLLQFMGNGPMYQFCYHNWIIGDDKRAICNKHWWVPLIFGSSVFNSRVDRQCLSWLWIISNEVIFFIGLVVVFYLYKLRALYGYLMLSFILFASVVVNLVEGILLEYMFKNPNSRQQTAILKITPINACQGYVLGVFLALMWFSYRNREDDTHRLEFVVKLFDKMKESKVLRLIFLFVGFIFFWGVIFLPYPIYAMPEDTSSQKNWKIVVSSIVLSFERLLIVLSACIFLIPSLVGKAGIFKELMGNRTFVPLARLNISALLVHGVILMWYFFGKYQILRLDPKIINMAFVALTLISYFFAIIFTLLFESPFITMENFLLCPHRKKKYGSFKSKSDDLEEDEDLMDKKSDDSIEIGSNKPEIDEKEDGDKVTNDSNAVSTKEIRMFCPEENENEEEGERKVNSMLIPGKKNVKKSLINGSEDSKHTDFNEALLN